MKNTGIALLAALASILLIDAGFRLAGAYPVNLRPAIHRASAVPGLEYELKPSMHARGFHGEYVTTDAEGFRSKPASGTRPVIAVLGDSYAFGFGVRDDETNPAVIADALRVSDVINTGVNGYNIEQEVLTYEAKISGKHPAVVILECTPNDGDRKAEFARDISERLQTSTGGIRLRGPRWWIRTSPVVDIIKRGIRNMKAAPATDAPFVVEWTPSERAYYERWFTRLSRDLGTIPKIFVLWPDYADRPETFAALKKMATENGWTVVDLSAPLGTRFARLGWDSHPSASVQKFAGDTIVKAILSLRLPGFTPPQAE